MAATYCDSSALVKRYVAEVGSAWVRRMVMRPARMVVMQAGMVLERHALRAYDAVQLACALTVRRLMHQRGLTPPLFVAADDVLLAAAVAEGFAVENPLLHP